jgi:invasion protein IalB
MLTQSMAAALSRSLMTLCCVAAIGAAAPALAQAQKKAKTAATTPEKAKPAAKAAEPRAPLIPWQVNCASVTGQMACEAQQTLTIQKTGQLLLKVTVRMPEKSKKGAMMLHLPHGMFLPDGVALAVDGKKPKKEPVQTCDQKGCYVGLALDDALLKEMQTGKTFSVAFKNLQKQDIKVPVSLSGFKEAYSKL